MLALKKAYNGPNTPALFLACCRVLSRRGLRGVRQLYLIRAFASPKATKILALRQRGKVLQNAFVRGRLVTAAIVTGACDPALKNP